MCVFGPVLEPHQDTSPLGHDSYQGHRNTMATPTPQAGGSRKRKAPGSPSSATKAGRIKKCDRRSCDLINSSPFCFVQASEKCAKDGYTSRWYHISAGQHFCNECFDYFYRSNKPGHDIFTKWSSVWEQEAGEHIAPGPKAFLIDQYLPIWVQCTAPECRKWRKLPPTIDLHHVKQDIVKCSNCSVPQDQIVPLVRQPEWMNTVGYTPLLRYSVLASLLSEYIPDGVGISPTTLPITKTLSQQQSQASQQIPHSEDSKTPQNGLAPLTCNPLHPFNHPQEGPRARAFTPDNMEPEEIEAFPEYYKVQVSQSKNHSPRMELYCLMRNLIVALWFFNYKVYLSVDKCVRSLSLRGVIRIWCAQELPRVLKFLTQYGYVNTGFFAHIPGPFPFGDPPPHETVLIVGAGTAGLAAAYHLRNFGYRVKILEASGRVGGRVRDNFSLGPCVGLGAMFITGINNNPLTLLARQLGVSLRLTNEDSCELISEEGWRPEPILDKQVEAHFNKALDKLADWRKTSVGVDVSLEDKLMELHQKILEEEGRPSYSEKEKRLLDFHLSNLEFACGAPLDKVSSFNWDHNDNFPQFSGCHALIPEGYMSILSRLAEGFDVQLDSVVKHVEITKKEAKGYVGIRVADTRGNEFTADRVILTVPLAVLKSNMVNFTPSLNPRKKAAIQNLGAGLVEKVTLKFPSPFWHKTVGSPDFFGHIASTQHQRGMFGMFYDLSSKPSPKPPAPAPAPPPPHLHPLSADTLADTQPSVQDSASSAVHYILVTTVSGEALVEYEKMSDLEIVERCVGVLRSMFPNEMVPAPIGYVVSRWGADPFAQMSYSYAAVGSVGEDYDALAEEVEGRLFFAGEATNRQFPQTVTGAYLSGLREASKIIARAS